MSFWKNEEEYKVKLVDFVERFVGHNRHIKLYTQKREKNQEGIMETVSTLVWKGMDWQIAKDYVDSDYFRIHPDVLPCPYGEANVVAVTSIGIPGGFADDVSLVIDEIPFEEIKKPEVEHSKPNTAVCNSDGEIKWSC